MTIVGDVGKSKQSHYEDSDIERKTFYGTQTMWDHLSKKEKSKFLYTKINGTLNYCGVFNPSIQYNIGDIVLDGNDVKVFDGQVFTVIEKVSELSNTKESKDSLPKVLPKNCTRCGAPVDSLKLKCAYCGCEY